MDHRKVDRMTGGADTEERDGQNKLMLRLNYPRNWDRKDQWSGCNSWKQAREFHNSPSKCQQKYVFRLDRVPFRIRYRSYCNCNWSLIDCDSQVCGSSPLHNYEVPTVCNGSLNVRCGDASHRFPFTVDLMNFKIIAPYCYLQLLWGQTSFNNDSNVADCCLQSKLNSSNRLIHHSMNEINASMKIADWCFWHSFGAIKNGRAASLALVHHYASISRKQTSCARFLMKNVFAFSAAVVSGKNY